MCKIQETSLCCWGGRLPLYTNRLEDQTQRASSTSCEAALGIESGLWEVEGGQKVKTVISEYVRNSRPG